MVGWCCLAASTANRNYRRDSRVRKWMLCAAIISAGPAQADGPPMAFEFQTAPRYPLTLYERGVSGSVLIELNGHKDGSITDVKVVDSSHPKFARSAERAVPQWRLKPWKVSAEAPETIAFREEIYFTHTREWGGAQGWMRNQIRLLSCRTFNEAVANFRTQSPDRDLSDMHVFRHTFRLLARSATRQKMSDDERVELGDRFVSRVPAILALCEGPQLRFKEALPKDIRARL